MGIRPRIHDSRDDTGPERSLEVVFAKVQAAVRDLVSSEELTSIRRRREGPS